MSGAFATTASGQSPVTVGQGYLNFTLIPERTYQAVSVTGTVPGPNGRAISEVADFPFRIVDQSVDPVNAPEPVAHRVEFSVEWVDSDNKYDSKWDRDTAWTFLNATRTIEPMFSGESVELQASIIHLPAITRTVATIRVTATMYVQADRSTFATRTIDLTARVQPNPGIQLSLGAPGELVPLNAAPDSWVRIPVQVQNTDYYEQQINLRVLVQPGDGIDPVAIPIRGDITAVFGPLETKIMFVEFKTPKAKTYYGSSSLTYDVMGFNPSNTGIRTAATGALIVQGFYFSENLIVGALLLILLLILFLLVLFKGKRYYEENILGKPIPPWRIPEEAEKLLELRKADPKAFYVTRYFLMEEEYQSSLNWFYAYKKRTKKELKRAAKSDRLAEKAAQLKEPTTVRFDRRAERIRRKIHHKQQKRRLKLEAKLERLQAKVDQHFEEDYEKDHEKWEKKVEKLKAKSNKPWFKAHKKWERDVEKAMDAWEKPFAKDKARREKEIAKAKEAYAKQVKKKDKEAWRAWMEQVEATQKENSIREKEDRELLPEPPLFSKAVGDPKIPPAFKEPPRPKLPPEPKEPTLSNVPPEPKLIKPKLEASHYAGKARRATKKTDRKVARLEKKLGRLLARNERKRVRAIAKAGRDREKLLRKSQRVTQPTMLEHLFRQTPEHRERRAHKKLLRALAKERLKALKEAEKSRIEVVRVEGARQEAELLSKLIRDSAEVRKAGGASGMRVEQEPQLVKLKETNRARLAREQAVSAKKIETEKVKIDEELRQKLTEALIAERTERAAQKQADDAAAKTLARDAAERKAQKNMEKAEKPPKTRKGK